jgi:hypothetical protein
LTIDPVWCQWQSQVIRSTCGRQPPQSRSSMPKVGHMMCWGSQRLLLSCPGHLDDVMNYIFIYYISYSSSYIIYELCFLSTHSYNSPSLSFSSCALFWHSNTFAAPPFILNFCLLFRIDFDCIYGHYRPRGGCCISGASCMAEPSPERTGAANRPSSQASGCPCHSEGLEEMWVHD